MKLNAFSNIHTILLEIILQTKYFFIYFNAIAVILSCLQPVVPVLGY